MHTKTFFLLTLLSVFFTCTPTSAQEEEITLSTYYPAPYGEYDELCAEKVLVWRPDGQELADMSEGDCHIGGSLIVGAGGTGFSYDELELIGATPLAQGTVLINGNVGIGTTAPASPLHVDTHSSATGLQNVLRLETEQGSVNDEIGILFKFISNIDAASIRSRITNAGDKTLSFFTSSEDSTDGSSLTEKMTITHDGNVGIGTTSPQARLEVASTNSGFLAPRFTDHAAIVAAMPSPAEGMMAYNLADHVMEYYNGTNWVPVGSGAGWQHDGTQVYNAVTPVQTWTDLDLSNYVGKRRALVMLKVKVGSGVAHYASYAFRTKGDTGNIGYLAGTATAYGAGISGLQLSNNNIGYAMVETDASGIIQFWCYLNINTNMWLMGYVKFL